MQYWLAKSEPYKYPWSTFVADGVTHWDGVRNYLARNNMMAMKLGDQVLYYHSNEGKEIVGVAEVVREHYADPTDAENAGWVVVDVSPKFALPKPVTLATIKADALLKGMELVRLMRLSVVAVRAEEFDLILRLGEVEAQ